MPTTFRDYYQTLGVTRTASADEIQRAFRKLARQYHPDVSKTTGSDQKFKEINEAYQVLSDPEKRPRYDALGENWKAGQEFRPSWGSGEGGNGPAGRSRAGSARGFRVDFGPAGPRGASTGDFSEFFESLFGGGARAGAGFDFEEFAARAGGEDSPGARHAPHSRVGTTHEAEITISLADAYHGATRRITLEAAEPDGRSRSRNYDVRIPPGITDGGVIRLAAQGGAGRAGGPAGDLLLKVRIAPDPNFRIESAGHDLAATVPIAPWEAALGAKVHVRTLDGEIVLTVPPGSQTGQRLRIRGKGLPKRSGGQGDLYVELKTVVPKELSQEERAAFEELRRVSKFDPRAT